MSVETSAGSPDMMRSVIVALTIVAATAVASYPSALPGQIGALSTDCKASGFSRDHRVYQIVATCPGRATSPDGRLAIVQRAYRDRQPPIELQDAKGRTLARLGSVSDDMPLTILWSPDSHWVAVNHHVGSFMDELHLFAIAGQTIVERPALVKAAKQHAVRRYPCLTPDAVLPNALRWSRDSRHLVLVTVSSLYACSDTARKGDWFPLWMIGDVRAGRVDPTSLRVDKADGPLKEPIDRLYRML